MYALLYSQSKEGLYATKSHSLLSLPYIFEQLKMIADETVLYKRLEAAKGRKKSQHL